MSRVCFIVFYCTEKRAVNSREQRSGLVYKIPETLQYSEAKLLTFFRVELGCKDIVLPDHGGEAAVIVCSPADNRLILRDNIEGMHKVEIGIIIYTAEYRRPFRKINRVPAHMRDLHALAEPYDLSPEYVEPLAGSELL